MPDHFDRGAVTRAAKALHHEACEEARRNGGTKDIDWVPWKHLPEFAREHYLRQARIMLAAAAAAPERKRPKGAKAAPAVQVTISRELAVRGARRLVALVDNDDWPSHLGHDELPAWAQTVALDTVVEVLGRAGIAVDTSS